MINNEALPCALQILELRTKVFDLNLKQIEQGYYSKVKELRALGHELYILYKSITKYDFISKIKEGNTLLVGEGNLSFTNSVSREGINGVNANYVLVRNFIISASHILKRNRVVLITAVDSDFYNNMFRFDELAEELRINLPTKYKFDPKDYPEYEHTMTHQEESGIDDYSKFATYEFRI